MKLSERLTTVANYIPNDSILADIGSDHAYLPIYAIQNGIIKKAIAGEVAEGPFRAAQTSVREAGLTDLIEIRKGDGLEVIHDIDHVDCITIAGMGGSLITSILENGKDKLKYPRRLVLQPNLAAVSIRKWLHENEWRLVEETIMEEDGHIYEILVADKGHSHDAYQDLGKELLFGPFLLREKSMVFKKKWERENREWERIYAQLDKAEQNKEIEIKKQELKQFMQWYREVIGE